MNNFDCKICGKTHKLYTSIKFPPPRIISEVTSGEVKKSLNLVAKNAFLIDKSLAIIESKLIIKIIDFDDVLELLVWVEVTKEEFISKKPEFSKEKTVILKGKLTHKILFYEDTDDLPVEILIDTSKDELAKIHDIGREIELKEDAKNGIQLHKLEVFFTRLIHQK